MHGTVYDIGLGLGLAAACGLRPFMPLLLAGALGSANALGVDFSGGYQFLESAWWLLAVSLGLVIAYALQLLLGLSPVADIRSRARGDTFASALAGLALGGGAVLFAGTLSAHGEASWPGLLGGILAAAVAQLAAYPVITGARQRLPDRAAREALTVYLEGASLLLAALVALVHPLGYLVAAGLAWFVWRVRGRGGERYAGLRILGR
jgi:hypothetical protein